MTTETPAQRRTRLIEEYTKAAIIATPDYSAEQMVAGATFIADAVIAATPAPQSEEAARYPSEIETRLIELCEECIGMMNITVKAPCRIKLIAIKRDLGIA